MALRLRLNSVGWLSAILTVASKLVEVTRGALVEERFD